MAEHHCTPALADDLQAVRDRTAYHAATEAGALASIFRQSFGKDSRMPIEFECAIQGALLRIQELCASVCVLQGDEWRDNIAEEYRVVFGKTLEVGNV